MSIGDFIDSLDEPDLSLDLAMTYQTWGDIRNISFDEFWAKESDYFTAYPQQAISELPETLETLCAQYEKSSCNPTYNGFKNFLFEHFKGYKRHLFLDIDLIYSLGRIDNEFKKYVKAKSKSPHIKTLRHANRWYACRNRVPTPNLRFDEVSRYLKNVQLFLVHNLKGKRAFEKVMPDKNFGHETPRRIFYEERKKGMRIIKNVEKGYFPGIYN